MTKTVEEKTRLIAELLPNFDNTALAFKTDTRYKVLSDFHPYTDTPQGLSDFLEVLRALPKDKSDQLEQCLIDLYRENGWPLMSLSEVLWYCDNKSKVLDCLVDILEGE